MKGHTWPVAVWERSSPQLDTTSELDALRSLEHVLAARVRREQLRTGEARPRSLSVLMLERVWDELGAAGAI